MIHVLYSADGQIFSSGPFATDEEAMKYVREKNGEEFDIVDQYIYTFQDGRLLPVSAKDAGIEDVGDDDDWDDDDDEWDFDDEEDDEGEDDEDEEWDFNDDEDDEDD